MASPDNPGAISVKLNTNTSRMAGTRRIPTMLLHWPEALQTEYRAAASGLEPDD